MKTRCACVVNRLIGILLFLAMIGSFLAIYPAPAQAAELQADTVVTVSTPTLTPSYGAGMCDSAWYKYTNNLGVSSYLTLNTNDSAQSTNRGEWRPSLPVSGQYRVEAYIPNHAIINWQCPSKQISWDTNDAHYTIQYSGGAQTIERSQETLSDQWLDLGTYPFAAGTAGNVVLVDLNHNAALSRTISFSSVRFTLISTPVNNDRILEQPAIHPGYGTGMCSSAWYQFTNNRGYASYLSLNTNQASASTNWAEWRPNFGVDGNYKVEVFIPDHTVIAWQCPSKTISWDTTDAHYTVTHANGAITVEKNQSQVTNGWIDLGTYFFKAGTGGWVSLKDLNHEADLSHTVSFSAARFTYVSNTPPAPTPDPGNADLIQVKSENVTYTPSLGDTCTTSWKEWGYGEGGHSVITLNAETPAQSTNKAVWSPTFSKKGWYRVEAFIPNHPAFRWPCGSYSVSWDTTKAKYLIHHATGNSDKVINQSPLSDQWVNLGDYYFNAGKVNAVELSDLTGEPFASHWVSIDDVRFTFLGDQSSTCGGSTCPDVWGTVGGVIRNSVNNQPVPGAVVTIQNKVVTTDASGVFSIDKIDVGDHTVSATKDGYATGTATVKVTGPGSFSVAISLTPKVTGGPLLFPLKKGFAAHPVSSAFDLNMDATDYALGLVSSYNGVVGYNQYTMSNFGAGWCAQSGDVFFYPGMVKSFNNPTGYSYNCANWRPPQAYNRHDGTDFVASPGDKVVAAAKGTVLYIGPNTVILKHPDLMAYTAYVHVANIGRYDANGKVIKPLALGDKVARGETIAVVQNLSSASHLHFGVKVNATKNWWDGVPANHSPIVDPFSTQLWASDSGVAAVLNNEEMGLLSATSTPPVALMTYAPHFAFGTDAWIRFSAAGSTDADGTIQQILWDFGDGTTGSGLNVIHQYNVPGTYYASLSVIDDSGEMAVAGAYPVVILPDSAGTELSGTRGTATLSAMQSVETILTIPETPQVEFHLEWTGDAPAFQLWTPDGFLISPSTPLENVSVIPTPSQLVASVTHPNSGDYRLVLSAQATSNVTWYAKAVDIHPPELTNIQMTTQEVPGQGTSVTINLSASDLENTDGMMFQYAVNSDGSGQWSEWMQFTSPYQFLTTEPNVESIAIRVRDSAGNVSEVYGDGVLNIGASGAMNQVFLPAVMR